MRTRLLTPATVLVVALVVAPVVSIVSAVPAGAKSVSQSQLKSLENELNRNNHLTFEGTYTAVNGGQQQSVTIAQAPPKSYFSASTGSVINTGSKTYFCSQSGSSTSCITESGSNPLLGLEDLFSPTVALAALSEAKTGLIARAEGVHVTSSSGNYAGQSATCISISDRGKGSGKYCITNKGVVAYVSTASNNYFQLTKYTSSPSSSLFNLPAGATTQTIPSIPNVSIPTNVSIPATP